MAKAKGSAKASSANTKAKAKEREKAQKVKDREAAKAKALKEKEAAKAARLKAKADEKAKKDKEREAAKAAKDSAKFLPVPAVVEVVPAPYDPKVFVNQTLQISDIVRDPALQVREKVNPATVQQYASAMQLGADFPAIVVFKSNEDGKDVYRLADGWTRTEASELLKKKTIKAKVYEGGVREAWIYAASNNVTHGAALTPAERKMVAEAMLQDPIWSRWSDREIGRRSGLSHQTIIRYRAELKAQAERDNGTVSGPLDQMGENGQQATEAPTRLFERGGQTIEMRVPAQRPARASEPTEAAEDEIEEGSSFERERWLKALDTLTAIAWNNAPERLLAHLTAADLLRTSNELEQVSTWIGEWQIRVNELLNAQADGTVEAEAVPATAE